MTKRGRGRPKGSPNKPKLELVSERTTLTNDADTYETVSYTHLTLPTNREV